MNDMATYEDEIRRQWKKIAAIEDGAIQLDIEHPLDWHVRCAGLVEQVPAKSLVIISNTPLEDLRSSKCITTACKERRDGRYAISFTLTDAEQEDIFFAMAADIIAFSQAASAEKRARALVRKRYAAWPRLLDHGHMALMSREAQKGLFAELAFLKETIEHGRAPGEAVEGWVGPEAADQDFIYADGWHEVKATGLASVSVTISSFEQLDCDEEGELIVYRIDHCAPARAGAISLSGMVHAIYDMLMDNTEARLSYEGKLADAGYIDFRDYDAAYFYLAHVDRYRVDSTFPRLRRHSAPVQVLNAKYQLDLATLDAWRK